MANIFKSSGIKGSAAWQTAYTAPQNVTSMVQNIHAANVSNDAVTVSVRWYDSSANATYVLANAFEIPANASLNVIDKAIILEQGDRIEVTCSIADGVDITLAYMQIG